MASNIFYEKNLNQIIARIKTLDDSHAAKWGKMNLPQMLQHCAMQLKLALGDVASKDLEGPMIYRSALGRWVALYAAPWPRGLPTPSKMNLTQKREPASDLVSLKLELLSLLDRVKQSQELNPHPFFGTLNQHDWGRLIWKHLDHHLKQFGA